MQQDPLDPDCTAALQCTGGDKNLGAPPTCDAPYVGNPIHAGTGNKYQAETDYQGRGLLPLKLVRHYNSMAGKPGRAGYDWNLFGSLTVHSGTAVTVTRPDRRAYPFSLLGGQWRPDSDVNERLTRLTDGAGNTTGWELALPDGVVESYAASGVITGYRHPSGLAITVADAASSHVVLADSFGRALTLDFNAQDNLETLADPAGGLTHYAYDAADNLASVTYPDGGVRTYHYEDSRFPHALTGITDENGQRYATWAYDDQGRAILSEHANGAGRAGLAFNADGTTTVTDAIGTARTYGLATILGVSRSTGISQPGGSGCSASSSLIHHDASGNVTARTDFNGHTTVYTYDLARNLETSRTEAAGTAEVRTIATEWHPAFRLPVKITEPGLETTYAYDARANVTQETRRDTQTDAARTWTWTYTYSATVPGALLEKIEDGPRLDVADQTTWTYYSPDAACPGGHAGCRGRLAQTADALGHITQITRYTAHGQPEEIVDPNGLVTILNYDVRQRLVAIDAGGEITAYAYDPAGQLIRATTPDGAYLAYTYDDAHRLTEVRDEAGNRIVYTLDALGNRTQEDAYDPQGQLARTRTRVYDALNRLEQDVGTAPGRATVYEYDPEGHPLRTLAPLTRSTEYGHDAHGRLTFALDPQGGQTAYAYDGQDRLSQVTDPKHLATTYTRNGFGEVTRIDSPDTGTTTLAYDPAGNLASRTDARSKTATYTYDALNRVTRIDYSDGAHTYAWDACPNGLGRLCGHSAPSNASQYEYDPHGRLVRTSQSVGTVTHTTAYTYDPAGRLASLTTPSGQVITYTYAGHTPSALQVNGQPLLTAITHAPFGPVTGWAWGNGQPAHTAYDLDGRPVEHDSLPTLAGDLTWDAADRLSQTAGPDGTEHYGYDPLDRLTDAAGPWGSQTFAYDASGDRLGKTEAAGMTQYTYGTHDHHLKSEIGPISRSYQYDAAGNLIDDGIYTYTYDGSGRLQAVRQAGTVTASYLYDALGRRVKKNGSATDGARLFVYDEAGHLLGEYNTAGVLISEYVWLGDTPVALLKPKTGSPTALVRYIHADHLGTPRRISVPANNRVIWRWGGAPFGETPAEEDADGDGASLVMNLRFPGQYYDRETGRHYNYFRDYDPRTGRYIQSDPIGLEGGINPYVYVGNAPTMYADSLGLKPVPCPPGLPSGTTCDNGLRNQDAKSQCVTAECAAGLVYQKPDIRTPQEVKIGQCKLVCQIVATPPVAACNAAVGGGLPGMAMGSVAKAGVCSFICD